MKITDPGKVLRCRFQVLESEVSQHLMDGGNGFLRLESYFLFPSAIELKIANTFSNQCLSCDVLTVTLCLFVDQCVSW